MSVFSGVGKEGYAWGRAGVRLSQPGVRVLKATPGLTLAPLSALSQPRLSQPRPFIRKTQRPHLAVTLLLQAELDC